MQGDPEKGAIRIAPFFFSATICYDLGPAFENSRRPNRSLLILGI
jgi:hypothetical protein